MIHEKLARIIRKRSVLIGKPRRLASGLYSSLYIDLRRTLSQPQALNLVADLLLPILRRGRCDYVGGLETGAIPILCAVAQASHHDPRGGIPLFWVRKRPKDHGTRSLIEGETLKALAGKTAVMVDDVATTGSSVLKAIEEARRHEVKVERAVVVVDRREGAKEALAEAGVDLISLFDLDTLGSNRLRNLRLNFNPTEDD